MFARQVLEIDWLFLVRVPTFIDLMYGKVLYLEGVKYGSAFMTG
jgi:hypothetical protein